MPRICGICGRPPREGETMRVARLLDLDDVDFYRTKFGHIKDGEAGKGLYMCCQECLDTQRERVTEKEGHIAFGMDPEKVPSNYVN